jgi:hypothetical protein
VRRSSCRELLGRGRGACSRRRGRQLRLVVLLVLLAAVPWQGSR